MLATGPLILLPFDIMERGPTRTAVDLLYLCLLPYLVWIVAIWLCGRVAAMWEYLALLVATLVAIVVAAVMPLPVRLLLPEGGSFKTDALQGVLFVAPVWLLLQFAFFATLVFDTIRRAILRAEAALGDGVVHGPVGDGAEAATRSGPGSRS